MPNIDVSLTTERGGHRVVIDLDGNRLETPPLEHLMFYAGLGVVVATNIIEPPVAIAIGVGHVLLELTRRPGLQALGEALEDV